MGTIKSLATETKYRDRPFDIVVIDSEMHTYPLYLSAMERFGLLAPGAVVIADNAGRPDFPSEFTDHLRNAGYKLQTRKVTEPYADSVLIARHEKKKSLREGGGL